MDFRAYVKEMHGLRSKIPSKKSRPYIHISRLSVKLTVSGRGYLGMSLTLWFVDMSLTLWFVDMSLTLWFVDMSLTLWFVDMSLTLWFVDMSLTLWFVD